METINAETTMIGTSRSSEPFLGRRIQKVFKLVLLLLLQQLPLLLQELRRQLPLQELQL